MRNVILAAVTAMLAVPAGAQGQARGGVPITMAPAPVQVRAPGGRWMSPPGGGVRRWHGGVAAPGGWAAYRRPVRGWALPRYWYSPRFFVSDFGRYGLAVPPQGYRWTRYYDDAVLVDDRGAVHDWSFGVDWDRDGGYDVRDQGRWSDGRYVERERRDDGVGGAVVGAIAGGVAGNVIAGRGDKLAGTAIGAAAGAVAGAAIDRAEDRGRDRPRVRHGADYATPGYAEREYGPRPEGPRDHVERRVIQADGSRPYTEVIRAPGTVTTITVAPAVTTTTTTTEYVYERPAAHRRGRGHR